MDVAPKTAARSDKRNAAVTLLVLVVTGAVIMAAAYFSSPQIAATTNPNGDFTAVTVDGQPAGAAPVVGQPAPDFVALAADGTSIRLSDLRGKPVWLTFGASWCQPCRAENPDIEATYTARSADVTVLQVYMDEDAAAVNDYAGRVGVTYLTVPDPNERLAAEYRILGIPSHFFIDSSGVLQQIKVGSLDPDSMKAALDQLGQ
jgi:cytochrome c biogenesis protein CcmG, thiol:disulfide interchange protein DsbE